MKRAHKILSQSQDIGLLSNWIDQRTILARKEGKFPATGTEFETLIFDFRAYTSFFFTNNHPPSYTA